ncbi:hypothetical protein PSC71_08380 [Devosia sp. J2-20]|uniref:hypothetical protein n=1 Tax=Devosia sp. J2-20 TaxID=3026161 RepID=UPI00249BF940|nr:hypothetical protein [Devosia sp. J2-20]WDR00750.1 hypothetical protein PSC71_08380 [Devosia sp. J2-20]
MAKATTAKTPARVLPSSGGSLIRDKATGALSPAPATEKTEPAAETVQGDE